ncbi:MAG: anhydro-N-acetylmuramic acid kinase [Nocardioidaceae bacterium]
MRVIGIMSGTSYDAIDVAAADLGLRDGEVHLRPLGALRVPYAEELRGAIAAGMPPEVTSYAAVCRLDTTLGQAFADAAARGIAELCDGRADLVVSHGQTMFHWVDDDGRARGTLQLGQPAWIAHATGTPVVSDLRSRDLTRGGQGAPLVSLFDVLLLASRGPARAALNLGGIANVTVLSAETTLAYDIGPANALIDAAARELCGEPYDADGAHAALGTVHHDLLRTLLDEPYYRRPAPKSTGKEMFHWPYLQTRLTSLPPLSPDDVIATVSELTATLVASELGRHRVEDVFVSGGGTRNSWLMGRLRDAATPGCSVRSIADLGVSPDDKEAYAFALLGFLTVHGIAGTVPSCTGASGPSVLGSITPGNRPLRLPEPVRTPLTRLVVT